MGGHGALISALKNPGKFRSVSALAPVCNPSQSPDERLILKCYFGDDNKIMEKWDSTCLVTDYKGPELNIFIHQVKLNNMLYQKCFKRISVHYLFSFSTSHSI